MQHGRVGASVQPERLLPPHQRRHAGGKGARAVVPVPVERLRQHHPLRLLQPDRMHIGDLEQQPSQLPGLVDAELGGLFDAVYRVRPGIGQPDHLRPLSFASAQVS